MKDSPADASIPQDPGNLHLLKGGKGVEIQIFALQAKCGQKCVISANQRRSTRETRGGNKINLLEPGYFWIPRVGRSSGGLGESPLVMFCIKPPERCAGDDGALGGFGHMRTLLRLAFQK